MRNDPVPLTRNLNPGTVVSWRTLDGKEHFGVLKEWDNGTAIVLMLDGKERGVRCD